MEYKDLEKKRYSPKEILAHIVKLTNYENFQNVDDIDNILNKVFLNNLYNNGILEELELNSLKKIENYWSLSFNQAKYYSYIVFNNLKIEGKKYTEEEITKMFIYVMQNFSPDNVEEMLRFGTIINKEFSPKKILLYLVNAVKNNVNIYEDIKNKIEGVFSNSYDNNEILDQVLLDKITNYWTVTKQQAICYSYIVFNYLKFENKSITEEEITDMFVYVMKLYSPNNAEEFIIKKNNKLQV